MPPAAKKDDRKIKDFFKPFTIPKSRIPANDVVEEEIVVVHPKPPSPRNSSRARKTSWSPRGRSDGNRNPKSSQSSSALSSLSSSPTTKSVSGTTPKQRAPISRPAGAGTSPLLHTSPPLSQQRVMKAVEIPTVQPQLSDNKPEAAQSGPLNTSFSSISTLSSIPASTQSSSRRIIKNGIQAITNSDSGSADSSDEEELPDISNFIQRKRVKLTPSPPAGQDRSHALEVPTTVKPSTRQSARLSEGSKQSSGVSTPNRPPTPPPSKPVYKYSLMELVKQREREVKVEKRMREMEEQFAVVERKRDEEREHDREAMSGLKAAVADDSDEGERMMLAVRRTGLLEGQDAFYYVDGLRENIVDKSFPVDAVADNARAWIRRLKDEKWRTQACLSGFVAELASRDGIPYIVQEWIAYQLMHEKRDDLCDAYAGILQVCREEPVHEAFTTQKLETVFKPMTAVDMFYNLRDTSVRRSAPQTPPRLGYILRAIQRSSYTYSASAIASTLRQLLFVNIDANVAKDAFLKSAVEDSIDFFSRQISETGLENTYDEVSRLFISSSPSSQLGCRAVASLPATSNRSHALRRTLALHLIIGEDFCGPLREPQHAETILSRLQKAPEFAISESTDYNFLSSLIQILEIAIDDGFDVCSSDPQAMKPPSTIQTPREREKAFNTQIDAFVSQLNLMSSRIRDAGTTHLQRTEAKSAIERLSKRLEYGVRTKPKPRKGIFSDGAFIEEGQREFLKGFLKVSDTTAI